MNDYIKYPPIRRRNKELTIYSERLLTYGETEELFRGYAKARHKKKKIWVDKSLYVRPEPKKPDAK